MVQHVISLKVFEVTALRGGMMHIVMAEVVKNIKSEYSRDYCTDVGLSNDQLKRLDD